MKKQTKKETKQKPIDYGMVPPYGGLLGLRPKGNYISTFGLTKNNWTQNIIIRKPVHCGTCKQDIKANQATMYWNAQNNYMVVGYWQSFINTFVGLRLIKFFDEPRRVVCTVCLLET